MMIRIFDRRVFAKGQDYGLLLFWHTDYNWQIRIVLSHMKLTNEEKIDKLNEMGIEYELFEEHNT